MVKRNVTLWFKDYPVFSLWLWHFGMDVFGASRGPYLGSWDERLQHISVLAARSLWLQLSRIEGSHVLPFMESFSAARLIRIKGIGRKGPTSAALPPVSVFRRQGPLPFSLNICLGWRSAPRMAAALLERVAASVVSHFLWREIRAGSGPITGMFTPTHLDRPSICRRGWWDHVSRTRVSSLSKKTLRRCQTEGLRVWQIGQGHLENKEDNPNSLIIISTLPIIFDTGQNLKG